jgi:hypothetical protein
MIPTAAIVMAPLTTLAGPVVSYNVLSVASPALAAFTAYLLCRRLVGRELPAAAGGYLFGFSSYEFAQLTGHLNLTLVFLIPLMLYVALGRADRNISRPAYVIGMAVLLILQAGLSTELLADSAGLGIVLLLSALWFAPASQRSRIRSLIVETLGAGLLALVAASPFFYYALFSGSFPVGASGLSDVYAMDLLNPLFPTYVTWLGHHDFLSLGLSYETGNVTEADGYLSIPILLAFVLWSVKDGWRSPLGRVVPLAAAISGVLALGSHLFVAGHQTLALPFNAIRHMPVINDILPSRLMLFTTLAISVGVTAWLAKPGGDNIGRWLVVILGAVLIFPNIITTLYGTPPHNPRFFSSSEYKRYLTSGETVLVLPYGSNDVSMLWQAETGFYFYMPEGYVSGAVPSPFDVEVTAAQLIGNIPPPAPALDAFIRRHVVSHVVVDQVNAGPWPVALKQIGLHGRSVGGVILYPVPSAPA